MEETGDYGKRKSQQRISFYDALSSDRRSKAMIQTSPGQTTQNRPGPVCCFRQGQASLSPFSLQHCNTCLCSRRETRPSPLVSSVENLPAFEAFTARQDTTVTFKTTIYSSHQEQRKSKKKKKMNGIGCSD